jgi:hypothetical protein
VTQVIEREASVLESSSSAITEKGNAKKLAGMTAAGLVPTNALVFVH